MSEQYRAGFGIATARPDFDFETYSEAGYLWDPVAEKWRGLPNSGLKRGLNVVGAAVYTEHPSCEVLSLFYDLHDGRGAQWWRPGLPNPVDLFAHVAAGRPLEAWNASFERWVWSNVCVPKYGWPPLPERALLCAMAKARAYGLPGALDMAGKVLQLPEELVKNPDGSRLLDKFSKPRTPTKKDARRRILPSEDPEDGPKLYAYNHRDIVAESAASIRIPDLTGEELEFWHCDQAINVRGVALDLASVNDCIALVQQAHAKYNAELCALTNGAVEQASQLPRLIAWLHTQGVHTHSLDEENLDALLERLGESVQDGTAHPDEIRPAYRALEIRKAVGSASVKKVYAMARRVTRDGRLHDLFNYHAARTGRPTGEGVQPTNMAREGPPVYHCKACGHHHGTHTNTCPWCNFPGAPGRAPSDWCIEAVEDALACIHTRSLEYVELIFGEAMATVAGCSRSLFVAGPGKELICSDYSAIEAVVLAAIAGEEWRLEVFRTHGKIYEMSASKITGVPFEEYMAYRKREGKHHPHRQAVGKIAELSGGFQAWIGGWKAFGADKFIGDDDKIKAAILKWRAASPAIVELWGGQVRDRWQHNERPELYGVEGMAISAILTPGQWFKVMRLDGTYSGVAFMRDPGGMGALYCVLPSGRVMTYHAPKLGQSPRGGLSISYEGYNTNPLNGPVGWITIETWGGRLVENIVQATARDIQRHAIVNLERCGYPVVLHVYDENVAEVDIGAGSLEQFEAIMSTPPPWAAGWPIKASGGWRGRRYRKG